MFLYMYICMYVCLYIHTASTTIWGMAHVCSVYMCARARVCTCVYAYGVARTSRLLKIIGLFCRISSLL